MTGEKRENMTKGEVQPLCQNERLPGAGLSLECQPSQQALDNYVFEGRPGYASWKQIFSDAA